ncbi:LemA family protein [Apilactobacillus xinyiensis]|uniref:LemA family protein n=1 Tax=Apilactobacillus xinyiensis TaxID=2841032 RepID=A0ABT0HZY2_9LACO|nr:LemA family protein [Apilactobacillus xinyiensis]MCK8623939.1 LemA family protein [Apilactobacillus xinyiensis]MCL0311533.1 LemA family protein [Apilactobacillus xinyiensis]MCL0318323.1 LemA family protein [Apilactobacillus xinyiensis]MCL0330089.1 LemA family protein [Apilactobacillus xinyiensis]
MWWIILIVVVALVLFYVYEHNRLQRLNMQVNQSGSDIDVQLKKRADLIPNLISTVKGAVNAERGTLERVTKYRTQILDGVDKKDYNAALQASNNLTTVLNATAESYPELHTNQNFMQLSETMTTIANQIASCQSAYNSCVADYNLAVQNIPSSFVAKMMNLKEKDAMIQATSEEKQNVNVNFDDLK